MKYDLSISEHNIRPHIDIQKGIQDKKNGLFTFNLRINQGNIEDFSVFETVTIKDYTGVTWNGWRQSGVSYHSGEGSEQNAVRPGER
jgi:hypothetical protein